MGRASCRSALADRRSHHSRGAAPAWQSERSEYRTTSLCVKCTSQQNMQWSAGDRLTAPPVALARQQLAARRPNATEFYHITDRLPGCCWCSGVLPVPRCRHPAGLSWPCGPTCPVSHWRSVACCDQLGLLEGRHQRSPGRRPVRRCQPGRRLCWALSPGSTINLNNHPAFLTEGEGEPSGLTQL